MFGEPSSPFSSTPSLEFFLEAVLPVAALLPLDVRVRSGCRGRDGSEAPDEDVGGRAAAEAEEDGTGAAAADPAACRRCWREAVADVAGLRDGKSCPRATPRAAGETSRGFRADLFVSIREVRHA